MSLYAILIPVTIGISATLLIFLGDIYLHHKKIRMWVYLLWAILLTFLSVYAFPIHADNYGKHPLDYEFVGHQYKKETFIIKTKKQEYLELADTHRRLGRKAYEDADAMCIYIPDWNDKNTAQFLFRTCLSNIVGGTPQTFAILLLLNGLTEYGICVWDRYDQMKQLLEDSRWHFEQRDKYLDLAAKYPDFVQ